MPDLRQDISIYIHSFFIYLAGALIEKFLEGITTFAKLIRATCHIFLGFKFLVRNKEKNGIPHEETRKIRGIFLT